MKARRIINDVELSPTFLNDKNPHKFAYIWSSGMYRSIQAALRTLTPNQIYVKIPNTFYFVKRFLTYFQTHGVKLKDLPHQNLYRGYTKEFQLQQNIEDNGFIATTHDVRVAREFAKSDGNIVVFDKSNLSKKIQVVVIDQRIIPNRHESEVLFMPGKLEIGLDGSTCQKYVPNTKYMEQFSSRSSPNIVQYGGGIDETEFDVVLAGKTLVFWRAIDGRPVEVFGRRHLPKTERRAELYVAKNLDAIFREYETITNMIPEVIDMRKKISQFDDYGDPAKEQEMGVIGMRLMTFTFYCALVDAPNNSIDTIHFSVYKSLFTEAFDMNRKSEVEREIMNRMPYIAQYVRQL